jgi:hypothetical protein
VSATSSLRPSARTPIGTSRHDVRPEQAPEMFGVAALGVASLPGAGPRSWCGGLLRKQARKGDRGAIAGLRSRNDNDPAEDVARVQPLNPRLRLRKLRTKKGDLRLGMRSWNRTIGRNERNAVNLVAV